MTNAISMTTRGLDRDTAHRLAGYLSELADPSPDAVSIFEVDDAWQVDAYFTEAPYDRDAYADVIADALAPRTLTPTWDAVPDENWVALSQAALPPVSAGRFHVHGRHDRGRVPFGPNAIEVEAGEAFGTAHHATTYGCLMAIDRLAHAITPRTVLDLGTGTGVLAIAAARAWPRAEVTATDIDVDAVRISKDNVRANRAANAVRCGYAASPLRTAPAQACVGRVASRHDLVIANILAGPLVDLSPAMARAVRPGGHLILSGLLNHQARTVTAAYVRHGFALARADRIEGWTVLTMQKRPGRCRPSRSHIRMDDD